MRIDPVTDPVYYPNSVPDAPAADTNTYAEQAVWAADGEMVRAAYTLHAEDDDYGQANTLINEVMDDAQRERLVANVAGTLRSVKRQEVLARAFEYWRNIDTTIGDKVRTATNLSNPTAGTVGTRRTGAK
jgi:catalase